MAIKDKSNGYSVTLDLIAEGGVLLLEGRLDNVAVVTPKAYFTADEAAMTDDERAKMIENKIIERNFMMTYVYRVSDRVWADMSGIPAIQSIYSEDRSVLNNALFASDWDVSLITARSYDYYRLFLTIIEDLTDLSMPWKGNEVYKYLGAGDGRAKPAYRFSRGEKNSSYKKPVPMNYSLANFFSSAYYGTPAARGMVTGQSAFIEQTEESAKIALIELITAVPERSRNTFLTLATHVYSQGRNDCFWDSGFSFDTKAALVNFIGLLFPDGGKVRYDNELKYSLGGGSDGTMNNDVYDELVRREMNPATETGKVVFSASNIHYLQMVDIFGGYDLLGQPYDGLQVETVLGLAQAAITTDAPADPYIGELPDYGPFEQFYLYRENLRTQLDFEVVVADAYRQTMPDLTGMSSINFSFKPDAYYQPMYTLQWFETLAGVTSPVVWKTSEKSSPALTSSYQNEVGGRVIAGPYAGADVNGFGFKLIPLIEGTMTGEGGTKSKLYPLFDIVFRSVVIDETTPAIGAGVVIVQYDNSGKPKIKEQVDGLVRVFADVLETKVPSYERDSNGNANECMYQRLIPEDAKTASVFDLRGPYATFNTPYQAMFNADNEAFPLTGDNALSLLGRNVTPTGDAIHKPLIFTFAARGVGAPLNNKQGWQDNSVPELVRDHQVFKTNIWRRSMTFIPRNCIKGITAVSVFECHEYDP
ncbi:putative tail sheath protein [Salmonella phage SPFM8]|nr:putative tail sheath protein [Salmonella phage SPFM8]